MEQPKKDTKNGAEATVTPKKKKRKAYKPRKKKILWGDDVLEQLKRGEYVKAGDNKHPKVNGLLRLAHELRGGIKRISTNVVATIPLENGMISVVVKEVEFGDGSSSSAEADAHPGNMNKTIQAYPTAVAGTRALSRAIRFAFGISVTAAEEHDPSQQETTEEKEAEQDPTKVPILATQVAILKKQQQSSVVTAKEFKAILDEISYKPTKVEELKTQADAIFVMKEVKKLAEQKVQSQATS